MSNYLTPQEILEYAEETGVRKAGKESKIELDEVSRPQLDD
jgi:hypothetical protein